MTDTANRHLQAEIKIAAVHAGLIDLDTLKLIDTSGISMDANGEIKGHQAAFDNARRIKPHLFKSGSVKNALEMSAEEYLAAKNNLIRRR